MKPNLHYITYRDADDIKAFYYALKYKERVAFVKAFVERTGIKSCIFFNWKGGQSQIYPGMKKVLEEIAGCKIFSPDNQL